jgi:peptidyl-dipeptidase A
LATIGLLDPSRVPPPHADLALLLHEALNKIAFLPFAYAVDAWRWRVFAGEVSPARYDDAWWELRRIHQGVRPPSPRPAAAFDPGAKFHVAASVPYLRYFLAYVLQFQLYEAACRQAGWSGPLHRCSVYGNREVGARFQRMLELGRSRPWPDALETFTGSRRMDASALARYFEPVAQWLREQNRGRQCGWNAG